MRIIILGAQKIAIDISQHILKTNPVTAVVPSDCDRDSLFSPISLKDWANKYNIPVISLNDIADYKPDIIFSIYYRHLLPESIISIPPLGVVNLHPSWLPKNRGPVPSLWSILRGETTTGTTLHYIDKGMDTGDIIAQRPVEIGTSTGAELHYRLMREGFKLFTENFSTILKGTNSRTPQKHHEGTCNSPFHSDLRRINWCQPAENILNQLRAFAYPYDGSIATTAKGIEVIMNSGRRLIQPRSGDGPGTYTATGEGLLIQTHDYPILIYNYRCEKTLTKGRFQ